MIIEDDKKEPARRDSDAASFRSAPPTYEWSNRACGGRPRSPGAASASSASSTNTRAGGSQDIVDAELWPQPPMSAALPPAPSPLCLEPVVHIFPPHDAARAGAPVMLCGAGPAVAGAYVVELLPGSTGPAATASAASALADCTFTSRNGGVNVQLWFEGGEKRGGKAVRVEATSANGNVVIAIPAMPPSSCALDLVARSHRGRVTAYLPATFRGTLILRSHSGSLALSDAWKRRGAARLPSPGSWEERWRVGGGEDGEDGEEEGEDGEEKGAGPAGEVVVESGSGDVVVDVADGAALAPEHGGANGPAACCSLM